MEYIVRHSKVVFPIAVIAAVAVTVVVALNAGNHSKLEEQAAQPDATEESVVDIADQEIPMVPNDEAGLSTLINQFYTAMSEGDEAVLMSSCDVISQQDMLRYVERAKYIDHYSGIEIYTKPGPEEGSSIVFVYYKITFVDHPEELPGYTAYYVCRNEQGQFYINKGEISDEANDYIGKLMSQDDVVEFNNRVTLEYNECVAEHPELLEYLSELDSQVNAAVGVSLADQNAESAPESTDEGAEAQETDQPEAPVENTVQYATPTTTVNVRASDSENADKVDKVAPGTQLQVLEQKVNGWTKVAFGNKEGFIKSEYLELTESATGMESIGKVTATTNINVRSSASETADRLGVLAGGDSVDLISSENGWCKIKYNGKVGYVKAEYVEQQ